MTEYIFNHQPAFTQKLQTVICGPVAGVAQNKKNLLWIKTDYAGCCENFSNKIEYCPAVFHSYLMFTKTLKNLENI